MEKPYGSYMNKLIYLLYLKSSFDFGIYVLVGKIYFKDLYLDFVAL
jgi:hypothetical protein